MNNDIPETDALWHLLGQSRPPAPSPFFARNVLREIRHTRPAPSPKLRALWHWLAPAAYASLAIGFFLTLAPTAQPPSAAAAAADLDPFLFVEFEDFLATLEFTPAHLAGPP